MHFKLLEKESKPFYQLDDEVDMHLYWKCDKHLSEVAEENAGYTDRTDQIFCRYYTIKEVDVALCYGDEVKGISLSETGISPPDAPIKEVLEKEAKSIWHSITSEWNSCDNGKTIGKMGSDAGTIIVDIEHSGGARITLEEKTQTAPFAITLGIYGLMFHTAWFGEREKADDAFYAAQFYIWKIFEHHLKPEAERNEEWKLRLDNYLQKLTDFS